MLTAFQYEVLHIGTKLDLVILFKGSNWDEFIATNGFTF